MTEEIYNILSEIGYSLQDHGQTWRTKPLYRESSNNTSLCIRKKNGAWVDFSANIGGQFGELVRLSLNLKTIGEAEKWLVNKVNLEDLKIKEKPTIEQNKVYPNSCLDNLLPIHDYWMGRGISKETLHLFRGGLFTKGQMAYRYVFPIFNKKDQIIGFAGRDVKNNTDRAKWKLIANKLLWVYPLFINLKIIQEKKEIILVESIGDGLALWEAGVKNFIVLFGVKLGGARLQTLLKINPKKIIISLNNDFEKDTNTGMEASKKIYAGLLRYFDQDQVVIKLPSKNDFGEMTKEEIIQWHENCS